ncbi:MAG: hypothetical protein U1F37_11485 [Alphaproteobacteria bacterium]
MRRTALLAATAALAAPPAAHAQDIVLVQHVTNVTLVRAGGAIVVNAAGTVPIAGFTNPVMRPRPDLVKVEGGYVLDFVAAPPPRGAIVAQVETRLAATFRIAPEEAEKLRFVQVRAALASRTVQVPAK